MSILKTTLSVVVINAAMVSASFAYDRAMPEHNLFDVYQNQVTMDHSPDGTAWILNNKTDDSWDGTVKDPGKYSDANMKAHICPSGDKIRGLNQLFDHLSATGNNPIKNLNNPTPAEVNAWYEIAINHIRSLVGYTSLGESVPGGWESNHQVLLGGDVGKIKHDPCLTARAMWALEKKNTEKWNRYENINGKNYECGAKTGNHCGATFIPPKQFHADYLAFLGDTNTSKNCKLNSDLLAGGSATEEYSSAPKSDAPWTVRFSRAFCRSLDTQGFFGHYVTPYLQRPTFGLGFWSHSDDDKSKNKAVSYRAKFRGNHQPVPQGERKINSVVLAGNFDAESHEGVKPIKKSNNHLNKVGYITADANKITYIRFDNFDFGAHGFDYILARISAKKSVPINAKISVRIGSENGTEIAVLKPERTGNWNRFKLIKSTGNQSVASLQTLYFVFEGSGYDLKSFVFINEGI